MNCCLHFSIAFLLLIASAASLAATRNIEIIEQKLECVDKPLQRGYERCEVNLHVTLEGDLEIGSSVLVECAAETVMRFWSTIDNRPALFPRKETFSEKKHFYVLAAYNHDRVKIRIEPGDYLGTTLVAVRVLSLRCKA